MAWIKSLSFSQELKAPIAVQIQIHVNSVVVCYDFMIVSAHRFQEYEVTKAAHRSQEDGSAVKALATQPRGSEFTVPAPCKVVGWEGEMLVGAFL